MLRNLSQEIRDCLALAEECARNAEAAFSDELREGFLRLEKSWLDLARSYELFDKLHDFTTASRHGSDEVQVRQPVPVRKTARRDDPRTDTIVPFAKTRSAEVVQLFRRDDGMKRVIFDPNPVEYYGTWALGFFYLDGQKDYVSGFMSKDEAQQWLSSSDCETWLRQRGLSK